MRIAVQVDLVPLDLDWSWRMMYTIHGLGRTASICGGLRDITRLWVCRTRCHWRPRCRIDPLCNACLLLAQLARVFAPTEGLCISYCLFAPAESSQADRVYRAGAGHRGRINAGQWRIGFRAMSAESEMTFGGCDEIWVGSHCGTKPCLILPVSSSTILRNPTSTAPPGLSSSHAAAASRDIETLHT